MAPSPSGLVKGRRTRHGAAFLKPEKTSLQAGCLNPTPSTPEPEDKDSYLYKVWKAWDEMYAAEGSDWFWWYGADMTTPGNNDTPF